MINYGNTIDPRDSLEAPIVCYVPSRSRPGKYHPIRMMRGGYIYCTCEDATVRGNQSCIHMPEALHILATFAGTVAAETGTFAVAPRPPRSSSRASRTPRPPVPRSRPGFYTYG